MDDALTKDQRYNRSAKGKARVRRYRQTPKGRDMMARHNARRVGSHANDYLGRAPTEETASQLNTLRREFRARQNES